MIKANKNGTELLTDTFSPLHKDEDGKQRLEVLRRFIAALSLGDLKINGQAPDANYKLSEYVIHGGRILFDLSALSSAERKQFAEYLLPPETMGKQIKSRISATHATQVVNGEVQDIKLKPLTAFARGVMHTTHYGLDIAIGGNGKQITNYAGKQVSVKNNGQFGHLYINYDKDNLDTTQGIQMGIEEAGALQTNQYSGDFHSPTGAGGKFSAFGETRLDQFQKGMNRSTQCPMLVSTHDDANCKYHWNKVKITPEILQEILSNNDKIDIQQALKNPHPKSISVENPETRYQAMLQWRKDNNHFIAPKNTEKKSGIFAVVWNAIKSVWNALTNPSTKESKVEIVKTAEFAEEEPPDKRSSMANAALLLSGNDKSHATQGLNTAMTAKHDEPDTPNPTNTTSTAANETHATQNAAKVTEPTPTQVEPTTAPKTETAPDPAPHRMRLGG